ncbi:MAG: homoserine dehydrogenase [Promethearchaeota archaeon]
MTKIAIIGMGTVGRQLVRIIHEEREGIERKHGTRLEVEAIYEYDGALLGGGSPLDLGAVVDAPDIRTLPRWNPGVKAIDDLGGSGCDIVVDVTPTNMETGEPALSHARVALKSGKDFVSSNKGPFYLAFDELKALAAQYGCSLGFEATVGSAIPVLASFDTLAGNEIVEIEAILNGTSNFILSRMTSEKIPFELALKEAKENGYAEADPSLDIDGYDAAGKLVILVNTLMGGHETIKNVKIDGIQRVTSQAIELARESGLAVKPLAIARDGTLEVGPRLVPAGSALAINGTLNAIKLKTKRAGDYVFIGRGAGGPEAATGILGDIIRIAKKKKEKGR